MEHVCLSMVIKEKKIFHWVLGEGFLLCKCVVVRRGKGGDLAREKTEVGEALLVDQASLGGNLGGGCGGQLSRLGSPGCLCDLQSPLLEVS